MKQLVRKIAVHLGLAVVASWPMVLQPTSRMVGHPDADVWNHAWGIWWFGQSIGNGALPWHTQLLFAPEGGTLWFIDPIGATLGSLFIGLLGVFGAYNMVILTYLAAASWAAHALARRLVGENPCAYAASIVVVFSPYLLSELHNGISEAVNVAPAIVSLALADRSIREGGRKNWLLTGGALTLTALGSAYYLVGTAIILGVWGVNWTRLRPKRDELKNAALGIALAGMGGLAIASAMWASIHAPDALIFRSDNAVDALKLHNAVDPRTYLAPLGFQSVNLSEQGEAFLHSGYLGWSVLLLAIIGVRTTKRFDWTVSIGISCLIGLGSHLFFNGIYVELGSGARLALPHKLLESLLPPQAITHSLRLAMPGMVLVAALAAAGLARFSTRWQFVAISVAIVDLLLFSGAPYPLARTPQLDTSAADWIAVQPGNGIVLDLPANVGNTMATSRYAVLQAHHQRPIPYRPDVRGSTSSLLGVPAFLPLVLASEHRDEHRSGLQGALQDAVDLDPKGLANRGVRYIVLHTELERGSEGTAELEEKLTEWFSQPTLFGEQRVWEIR